MREQMSELVQAVKKLIIIISTLLSSLLFEPESIYHSVDNTND